jgi:hypothetical protein
MEEEEEGMKGGMKEADGTDTGCPMMKPRAWSAAAVTPAGAAMVAVVCMWMRARPTQRRRHVRIQII